MIRERDNKLDWSGEMPEGWLSIRIKYLSKRIIVGLAMPVTQYYVDAGVPMFRNTNIEEDFLDDSDILFLDPDFAKGQESKWIKENDILTIHTGYIGKSCVVPAQYNNALTFTTLITTPDNKKVYPRFLMYAINSSRGKSSIYITESTAQSNLNTATFVNLTIPAPSLLEQNRIVTYLDKRCPEVDALIADIHSQIETLEAYKRSIITETVTKGLDKNTSKKDSHIEWAGSIPNSWRTGSISYYTESRSGGTPDRNNMDYWEDGTVSWMASGEVNKTFVYETNEHITELATKQSSAKVVPANSVMVALNGQGKTKGMSAVLKIDAACNQSLCAFQCDEKNLHYMYLFYCFQAMYKYLRSQAGNDVRDGLAASFVKKQRIPLPEIEEQKIIAQHIYNTCKKIDSVLEVKRSQLGILLDYKKSLIYEYVTGKKEVPQ